MKTHYHPDLMIFLFCVEDSTLGKSATSSYGHGQVCNRNAFFLDRARKRGFPGDASGKEPICQCRGNKRHRFDPRVQEDPLEEGMATYSSILAWRIA